MGPRTAAAPLPEFRLRRSASREELVPAKFIDVFDAEAEKIGGVEHLVDGNFNLDF
jgi:GMP synthase PP-ATPase subunit